MNNKNQNRILYSGFGVFRFCSILSATMQRGLHLTVVGTFLCLSATSVFARESLKIDTDKPADFQAIQDELDEIDNYLSDVQCGGFDMTESVAGKIATVTGVPGRNGIWYAAPLSGMALRSDENANGNRDDDFVYPDSATGYGTACVPGTSQIPKSVWRPGGSLPNQVIKTTITFPHPKFEDPSCRWRAKNSAGNFINSAPVVPLEDDTPVPPFEELTEGTDRTPPGDRHSPELCQEFCGYINTWQYRDCLEVGDATDEATGTAYNVCLRWGIRYLCSDQEVTDSGGACNPGAADKGNARQCRGEECRCMRLKQDVDETVNPPTPTLGCVPNPGTGRPLESSVYYSYFRRYSGTFSRDAVPSDGPDDDTARSRVQVACYGFYDEFDPKFHQTETKDRRCVINVDVSTMRDSQMGKGNYGEDIENMIDTDPVSGEEQRVKEDDAKDLWYLKLGWGFSLLKEDVFESDYNNDLAAVFGDTHNLDRAKMTGSWPVSRDGNSPHLAVSDGTRAFDDTGEPRIISNWLQKQYTDITALLHPPIVRIVLPPAYSFGADAKDPLFAAQSSSSSASSMSPKDAATGKRSKRIEIQIDAREDILGEVLGVIERSFLVHLEEDPVPALVVAASPTELRSRAMQWCTWYMQESGEKNCDTAPPEVRNVIDKLQTYADDIEKVRELRAVLARYAGKVIDIQTALTKPISEWMVTNLTAYNDYIRAQIRLGAVAGEAWNDVRKILSDFHDVTNMPWCMNQRFTSVIYSMLDRWMPSRADNGKLTADGLPNLTAKHRQDVIIDFSHLRYMTGSLLLPVLKPVQVRLKYPRLPASLLQTDLDKIEQLPDLPSIDDIKTALYDAMNTLPEVTASAPIPPLELPPADAAVQLQTEATILQIKDVVTKMNDRYDRFWKSIGPLSTEEPDAGRDGIPAMKAKLECKFSDEEDPTCQHVEMDLRERFQRIGSRKMVFLREDYASDALSQLSPAACLPHDDVCLLLHGEKNTESFQWDIIGPKIMPDPGSDARAGVRDATLPTPIGNINPDDFPPYDTDIKDLLQFYDVPKPLNLVP